MKKHQMIFNTIGFTLLLMPIIFISLKVFTDIFNFMYSMNPIPIVIGTICYLMFISVMFGPMLTDKNYFIPVVCLIVYLMIPVPVFVFDSLNDDIIESSSKDSFYYKVTLSKIVSLKNDQELKDMFMKYNISKDNLNGFIMYSQKEKHRGLILELDNLNNDLSSLSELKEFCKKKQINCLVLSKEEKKYLALNDFKIENTFGEILFPKGKEIPNKFEIKVFNQ